MIESSDSAGRGCPCCGPRCGSPLASRRAAVATLTALSFALPFAARAGDWPSWRGPGGVGASAETSVPAAWDPKTRAGIRWVLDDPGFGHSSPIVAKGALFFTSAAGNSRMLLRCDPSTGKEIWRHAVLEAPLEGKHTKNSHASSTPATDGVQVYTSFLDRKKVVAVAIDFDGKEVWRASPGEFHSVHGFCSTPVLFQDLVILNCDQDAEAYVLALDAATGAERWRTGRENRVRSYCPPTIFDVSGSPQMVLSGSKTVASFDPRTGKRLWVCDGPTEQCVASVVLGQGIVFVTGGFPDRWILGIDPTGSGDVTKTHVRWRTNRGVSYVPSPLYHDGFFYVVADNGVLSALEAKTGEFRGQKRLRGDFSASLLYAAGRIYAFSEEGEVFVMKSTPDLETVAEISMGEPIYATPAVSNGTIYLRTWKRLYAIGG